MLPAPCHSSQYWRNQTFLCWDCLTLWSRTHAVLESVDPMKIKRSHVGFSLIVNSGQRVNSISRRSCQHSNVCQIGLSKDRPILFKHRYNGLLSGSS
ncbi:hypothetical protein GOP47_0005293 [Adiantum capillus-veneris]|uniref:Uncharacterized protein n=1 Tax=Adiantum capillus-veneris TaxID=13818 RepID=A0A9D4V4V6_ADICA|nr:hypothetical protein GOP47_0005293 [Adiantum capillus-veneris]